MSPGLCGGVEPFAFFHGYMTNVWSKSTSFADSVTPYCAAISTKSPAKIRNDAVPDGTVSLEAIPSSLFIFVCSNKLVDMKKIVQRQELHLLSKATYLRLPQLNTNLPELSVTHLYYPAVWASNKTACSIKHLQQRWEVITSHASACVDSSWTVI